MIARFGKHLVTSAVIKSNPGDFLSEYFCIVNLTSLGVKCFTGRDIGRGESRCIFIEFVVIGENVSGLGWKIS
jgi:hypothetical protein